MRFVMVREWWDKGWITWGLLAILSVSILMLILSLARKPFSVPWVEREPERITLRLDQMIAAEVDQAWTDARLEAALAEDPRDWFKIDLILEVAAAEQVSPDPALKAQMESARKSDEAMLRRVDRCAQCASDTAKCLDLHTLAICNTLSEMGRIGDVKTLVRNAKAQMAGEQVDYHEVGIAFLGLGYGVLRIAGPMVGIPPPAVKMVKRGVKLLRRRVKVARSVQRRAVFLTESFEKEIYRYVRALDLQWSKIPAWVARGGGDVAQVLNPVTLSRLRGTVADLGRIYHAAPSLDGTWRLLRHVDNSADATRLARLAETVGASRTHQAFHVLGKPRVFRAMVRLSDAVITTIIWIIATVVLAAGLVASVLLNQNLRLSLQRFVWHTVLKQSNKPE